MDLRGVVDKHGRLITRQGQCLARRVEASQILAVEVWASDDTRVEPDKCAHPD